MSPSASQGAAAAAPPRRWIISPRVDQLLILLTPLLAIPAVVLLYSPYVGMTAETISLIVTAFFATGHHLPGLIRAYGDRELFERFRWRFLLAPPLVFLAYFPLYTYHYDLYRLIILSWATWHGLMQLYGFVRIYDAKVGSVSPATAYWDWLLCLCGFITPQLFRPDLLSSLLRHWYSTGGPLISASVVNTSRWALLGVTIGVLIGFTVNYAFQWVRGPKPNPLKLLMLVSGIGTWWFALLALDSLLLSVALFDICHDVQYLAIVWLYNCRRVGSNARLSGFMKFVFRRGMVLLYLALITAYGAIGLAGPLVDDGTVSRFFYGVLFTSTILHYYYDGFIWKVRESTTQSALGLASNGATSRVQQVIRGNYSHLLKWSPVIVVLGLLFATDFVSRPLSTDRKAELERLYAKSLLGNTALPTSELEQSWLYSYFEQTQNIAAAVPSDRSAQLRAAVMLANFGRNDEAIRRIEDLLQHHSDYSDAHATLGEIHLYRGDLERALASFEAARDHARSAQDRSKANLKISEIHLHRKDYAAAQASLLAAQRDDPELAETVDRLRARIPSLSTSQ